MNVFFSFSLPLTPYNYDEAIKFMFSGFWPANLPVSIHRAPFQVTCYFGENYQVYRLRLGFVVHCSELGRCEEKLGEFHARVPREGFKVQGLGLGCLDIPKTFGMFSERKLAQFSQRKLAKGIIVWGLMASGCFQGLQV